MNEVFKFMSDSPFLTFFILFVITETVIRIIRALCRSMNIKAQGWPPKHCDADGDLAQEEEEENT